MSSRYCLIVGFNRFILAKNDRTLASTTPRWWCQRSPSVPQKL